MGCVTESQKHFSPHDSYDYLIDIEKCYTTGANVESLSPDTSHSILARKQDRRRHSLSPSSKTKTILQIAASLKRNKYTEEQTPEFKWRTFLLITSHGNPLPDQRYVLMDHRPLLALLQPIMIALPNRGNPFAERTI
jgi:hypothetical protein